MFESGLQGALPVCRHRLPSPDPLVHGRLLLMGHLNTYSWLWLVGRWALARVRCSGIRVSRLLCKQTATVMLLGFASVAC